MNLTDYCKKKGKSMCGQLNYKTFIEIKKKLNIFPVLIRMDSNNVHVFEFRKFNEEYFKEFYEVYMYLHNSKAYYVWWREWHLKHFNTKTKHQIGKKKKNNIVFERDGNECVICNSNNNLTLDHIIPISISNDKSFFNLMTLCEKCNHVKGNTVPNKDFIKNILIPKIKKANP